MNQDSPPVEKAAQHPIPRAGAVTLALVAGILLHAGLGWRTIRAQSATFDEPPHLVNGYAYLLTGQDRINGLYHPPLAQCVAALPLLALKPDLPTSDPLWQAQDWTQENQYAFANLFLFHNPSGLAPDLILDTARAGMLALSCLFAPIFWGIGRRCYGARAAWVAFFLYVLHPAILAAATLVTTDLAIALFFFLFFICWGQWESRGGAGWGALSGLTLGLAFGSKFTALAALPVLALWLVWRKGRVPFSPRSMMAAAITFSAVLAWLYRVHELPVFWAGLKGTLFMVKKAQPSFLLGRHRETGWWYYFPLVFLMKTPLPLLLALGALTVGAALGRVRLPWYLVLPPLVYFLLVCRSTIQIGHRHLLPVYPFLFQALGIGAALLSRHWKTVLAAAVLGAWYAAGTLLHTPYFLAYFNETVGGPAHGYRYVTDSNVDWGQGLRALRDYVRQEGVGGFYLSYFGTADPAAYSLNHVAVGPVTMPAFRDADLDLRKERKALLVVSATNYQSTYYRGADNFDWLRNRTPIAVLAHSLLVFDITRDREAHARLAAYFASAGRARMAAIEEAWAAAPPP